MGFRFKLDDNLKTPDVKVADRWPYEIIQKWPLSNDVWLAGGVALISVLLRSWINNTYIYSV